MQHNMIVACTDAQEVPQEFFVVFCLVRDGEGDSFLVRGLERMKKGR